jgi:hypothetical protein
MREGDGKQEEPGGHAIFSASACGKGHKWPMTRRVW